MKRETRVTSGEQGKGGMAPGSDDAEIPNPSGPTSCVPVPGNVIAGKYEIERVVGSGGMGVVLAARHKQLGQSVAIKLLHAEAAADSSAATRFLREARSAVALVSEHVTRVLDVGELESGAPFMVMEYLAGVDLAQVLHKNGHLEIPCAVRAVLQACEAIAEAHSISIVHRDLKPANLFVTQRVGGTPLIKVLDFGISKMTACAVRAHGCAAARRANIENLEEHGSARRGHFSTLDVGMVLLPTSSHAQPSGSGGGAAQESGEAQETIESDGAAEQSEAQGSDNASSQCSEGQDGQPAATNDGQGASQPRDGDQGPRGDEGGDVLTTPGASSRCDEAPSEAPVDAAGATEPVDQSPVAGKNFSDALSNSPELPISMPGSAPTDGAAEPDEDARLA